MNFFQFGPNNNWVKCIEGKRTLNLDKTRKVKMVLQMDQNATDENIF